MLAIRMQLVRAHYNYLQTDLSLKLKVENLVHKNQNIARETRFLCIFLFSLSIFLSNESLSSPCYKI